MNVEIPLLAQGALAVTDMSAITCLAFQQVNHLTLFVWLMTGMLALAIHLCPQL